MNLELLKRVDTAEDMLSGLNDFAEQLQDERVLELREAIMTFTVELLKSLGGKGNNALFSPVSVMAVLAMLSDGANGATKAELEQLLGADSDELFVLFQKCFMKDADGTKWDAEVNFANGILLCDNEDIHINEDFLEKYTSSPIAELMKVTADDVCHTANGWVNEKTKGKISNIINGCPKDLAVILLNAIYFKGEWQDKYELAVREWFFETDEKRSYVSVLWDEIKKAYLSGKNATGFIKKYRGGQYSFAAILPDYDTPLPEYISKLSGSELLSTLKARRETVSVVLPKFKNEAEIDFKSILEQLGNRTIFNPERADFSKLATTDAPEKNICVDDFRQKAVIALDENGTEAAAVTFAMMKCFCYCMDEQPKEVHLTRPFLYMIIDNRYNIPLFVGTIENDKAMYPITDETLIPILDGRAEFAHEKRRKMEKRPSGDSLQDLPPLSWDEEGLRK